MDEPQEIMLRQRNLIQIALYCMTLFILGLQKRQMHNTESRLVVA